jgi:hypothetical protein
MPQIITLGSGQEGLFGYGSLLCKRSMEKTLGKPYTGPFISCLVRGWRRTWDVFMPNRGEYVTDHAVVPANIVYLNVQRDPHTSVSGILYVVSTAASADFDAREWVYDRVEVTPRLQGVDVRGGHACMYVAKPEFLVTAPQFPEYAVRQTYIQTIDQCLSELGPKFRATYDSSSDPVPAHLIVRDRPAAHPFTR